MSTPIPFPREISGSCCRYAPSGTLRIPYVDHLWLPLLTTLYLPHSFFSLFLTFRKLLFRSQSHHGTFVIKLRKLFSFFPNLQMILTRPISIYEQSNRNHFTLFSSNKAFHYLYRIQFSLDNLFSIAYCVLYILLNQESKNIKVITNLAVYCFQV